MKNSLFFYFIRARSAHKTKERNKEFFALRLQYTPNGNQSLVTDRLFPSKANHKQ